MSKEECRHLAGVPVEAPAPLGWAGHAAGLLECAACRGFPLQSRQLQRGFLPNEISDTKQQFFCYF